MRGIPIRGAVDHRRSIAISILFVASALALAGCSSTGLEPPDVTLAGLKVTEVKLFETTAVARLRIHNPNSEALTINGASLKLELDGKKVGRGSYSDEITVERLDSGIIDVDFYVDNTAVVRRLRQIVENEAAEYRLYGTVYLDVDGSTRKLKIDRQGRVDAKEELGRSVPPPEDLLQGDS